MMITNSTIKRVAHIPHPHANIGLCYYRTYRSKYLEMSSFIKFDDATTASDGFMTQQLPNWRASVASETLTGVTQLKIGDVCLFIDMFGRMYVILYFDPPYFCVRSAFDPVPNFTKQNPPV